MANVMAAKDKEKVRRFAKGEETRLKIIKTALRVFGLYSLSGATSRMIAKEADVNLGVINYYFGNKQNLNEAVAEYASDFFEKNMRSVMEKAHCLKDDKVTDRDVLLNMLLEILMTFAKCNISEAEGPFVCSYFMREQIEPTTAYDILYERTMKAQNDMIAYLVGTILGEDPKSTRIILKGTAILGQILTFTIAQEMVTRRTGWQEYGSAEMALVEDVIRENTEAILLR